MYYLKLNLGNNGPSRTYISSIDHKTFIDAFNQAQNQLDLYIYWAGRDNTDHKRPEKVFSDAYYILRSKNLIGPIYEQYMEEYDSVVPDLYSYYELVINLVKWFLSDIDPYIEELKTDQIYVGGWYLLDNKI